MAYDIRMKKTCFILVSDGILNRFGRVEAVRSCWDFLSTGKTPSGWVCDVSNSGLSFHLPDEEGNLLCDPGKPGYQDVTDLFSDPKGRA